MRIVLLGRTGVGKSATGNTILGDKQFLSKLSGASVTTHCKIKYISAIQVVDTPGFFDTKLTNEQISKEVAKCIAMSSPGAHAFIIVVNFNRFTKEEADTVDLIKATLGQEVMKYMIVLFVGKDNLEAEDKSFDEFLKESPDTLTNLLRDCENRYIIFNNRAGPVEQMRQAGEFMARVNAMIEGNGGRYYEDEIYADVEKQLRAAEEKKVKDKEIKESKDSKRAILQNDEKNCDYNMIPIKRDYARESNAIRKEILVDVESGKITVIHKKIDGGDCSIM